jgi:uncharacterized protein (DUF1697 family)
VPTHAAFLKGINLGNRRLRNDELRAHFEAIGLTDVATFRASGNVVFSCPRGRGERALMKLIEAELGELLGYEVATFVRDRDELLAIAAAAPFDAKAQARTTGKPQVMLMAAKPTPAAARKGLALAGPEDELALLGRELHWLPAGGISDSKLDLKALERVLGPMTIRTKGTIEQIASRHFAS